MSSKKYAESEIVFITQRAMVAFGCKKKKDLSKLFGILPQDMTARIKRGTIVKLIETEAYKQNVNFNYILTGEGTPDVKRLKLNRQRPIPIVGRAPAGFPESPPEDDQILDYLYVPDVPRDVYAMEVIGDSMSPTVKNGEYAIFELTGNVEIKSGDVVIARNEWNELLLKRYRVKDGKTYLTSDNPEYPVIKPNEHYKIVGKVFSFVKHTII